MRFGNEKYRLVQTWRTDSQRLGKKKKTFGEFALCAGNKQVDWKLNKYDFRESFSRYFPSLVDQFLLAAFWRATLDALNFSVREVPRVNL